MKSNKGLEYSDIEAIIAKPTVTGSAYGAITKVIPYMLLKDGTIYSRPYQSHLDFEIQKSKATEKHRWGNWTRKGAILFVTFKNSQEWKNVFYTSLASPNENIEGVYQTVGGFSKSGVHKFNTLMLKKNGSFTWRYFYRTKGTYQPHQTDKKISGTYTLSKYTITFKFDNGVTERFMFTKYPNNEGIIMGGKSFYAFKHPMLTIK